MTSDLQAFLREWLTWAEAGAPNDRFLRRSGLCTNSIRFIIPDCEPGFRDLSGPAGQRALVLQRELTDRLREELSYDYYPFGQAAYHSDYCDGTQHRNPERLAWVRKTLSAGGRPVPTVGG